MSRNRAWVVVLETCNFRKIGQVQNRYVGPRKEKPKLSQFFSLHPLVNDLSSVEIVKGLWELPISFFVRISGNKMEYVSWGNT